MHVMAVPIYVYSRCIGPGRKPQPTGYIDLTREREREKERESAGLVSRAICSFELFRACASGNRSDRPAILKRGAAVSRVPSRSSRCSCLIAPPYRPLISRHYRLVKCYVSQLELYSTKGKGFNFWKIIDFKIVPFSRVMKLYLIFSNCFKSVRFFSNFPRDRISIFWNFGTAIVNSIPISPTFDNKILNLIIGINFVIQGRWASNDD